MGFLLLFSSCKETEVPIHTNPTINTSFLFKNNYHSTLRFKRLSVERSWVHYPGNTDWHYAHHPSIINFNGLFVAIFSNGVYGEDEGSQRILTTTSEDGKNWSEAKVLATTDALHSLTAGGLYISESDELIAYFTISDYANVLYQNSRLMAKTSTDGTNWSERIDLNIPLFMSHSPIKTKDNRLLVTGGKRVYFSDNLSGLSDWKLASNASFNGVEQPTLVEGDILEIGDSLYIQYRDVKGRTRLWQQSSKSGDNWTTPRKTSFSNAGNKFHFEKLPNGMYYYIGTPDSLRIGTREPLILALSKDGYTYDKNYIVAEDNYSMRYKEGRWKEGQFGYPYSIVHEGYIYVIVSRQKESIEIIKISLEALN